jgi:hypothetical protein
MLTGFGADGNHVGGQPGDTNAILATLGVSFRDLVAFDVIPRERTMT